MKKRRLKNLEDNCLVKRRRENCLDDAVQVEVDDLPENCIFYFFVRLPLESLCNLRLVCKSWKGIVNSTNFPDTRGIIFSTPVENYSPPPVFSPETNSIVTDLLFSFHIKFMEFDKDGTTGTIKEYNTAFGGRITATCDGLIVLEKDFHTGGGLLLLNPVTRELQHIPNGTKSSSPGNLYGLASCRARRYYKLLHLFMKGNALGCEVMDIIGSGSGPSWRAVEVPPTKHYHLMHNPVFAMGALHWIQCVDDDVECMVSMSLDDDNFKTTPIPTAADSGGLVQFNTVFAMGEFLGFSSRASGISSEIQVWILKGTDDDHASGCWEKQFNIDVTGLGYLSTPLLFCGDGRLVFKCVGDNCLYAYNRHSGRTTKVRTINKWADTEFWTIFPHVNSHVSWRR